MVPQIEPAWISAGMAVAIGGASFWQWATGKAVKEQLSAVRESLTEIKALAASAQTQLACERCRREVDAQISALPSRRSVDAAHDGLRRLEERLSRENEERARHEGKVDSVLAVVNEMSALVHQMAERLARLEGAR